MQEVVRRICVADLPAACLVNKDSSAAAHVRLGNMKCLTETSGVIITGSDLLSPVPVELIVNVSRLSSAGETEHFFACLFAALREGALRELKGLTLKGSKRGRACALPSLPQRAFDTEATRSLVSLCVTCCDGACCWMRATQFMPRLAIVFVSDSGLVDSDVRSFVEGILLAGAAPSIVMLHLNMNRISCAGLVSLSSGAERGALRRLIVLNISGNCVGRDGFRAICSVSESLPHLSVIDASCNRIDDAPDTNFPSLTSLGLASNRMGDCAVRRFLVSSLLPKLSNLDLSRNPYGVEAVLDLCCAVREKIFPLLASIRIRMRIYENAETLFRFAEACEKASVQYLIIQSLGQWDE